jgi:hypothetical protein
MATTPGSVSGPTRLTLYGIAVVCFASLLLEVVLTRIFSATMYYHFTFLAIALALFGVGASGVYVYVRSERFPFEKLTEQLTSYANKFAATTVLALVYVLANPIETITGKLDPTSAGGPAFTSRTLLQLILLNGFAALPFFYSGMVVSLSVAHWRRDIDRVYFFDLCGAGLAALLAGVLLGLFGGPQLVIVVAVAAAAAAVMFSWHAGGWRRAGTLAAIVVLFLVNAWTPFIKVPSLKGVDSGKVQFERWNAFSRVTAEKLPGRYSIKIDASAATDINSLESVATRKWAAEVSAFAYGLFPGGASKVLIIGPGGGNDVVNALASGAKSVTGVEVNPIIADKIMKGAFLKESGGLYHDPRVHVVADEGRSFIRRSSERFEVIQATLVDTWAATAAGAFALTENTLYSLEAFEDYYAHLSDTGVVTMTRWYQGDDPESSRLVLLAAGALEKTGVPANATRKHIYFARRGGRGTLVAKRTEFTPEELALLDAAARTNQFETILSPTTPGTSNLEKMVDAGAWSRLVRAQGKDLTPPTDDRPFFFYFLKPGELWNVRNHFKGDVSIGNPAVWILLAFGFTVIALAIAFIVLPLVVHRRDALRGGGPGGAARRGLGLVYFALLGLAFITVEVALLQKFGFFLGHPAYALVVVLFSILFATAGGARLSGRIPAARRGQAALVSGLLLAAVCGIYAMTLNDALRNWVAWGLAARVLTSAALVGLCGVLMGVMLPTGVKLVAERDASIVPWGWGINGATSVIGTVGATIIAIHHGFTRTLLVGAVTYAIAGAIGLLLARKVRSAEGAAELPSQAASAKSNDQAAA